MNFANNFKTEFLEKYGGDPEDSSEGISDKNISGGVSGGISGKILGNSDRISRGIV